MQLIVMYGTERHGKLVAYLQRKAPALRKFQVVRVGWQLFANKAGSACNEPQVVFVTNTPLQGDREHDLVYCKALRDP